MPCGGRPCWARNHRRALGAGPSGGAAMGAQGRVRSAKCQLLATCFFTLLLSLSWGVLTFLTRFGDRFVIIHSISPERGPYGPLRHWALSAGLLLTSLLTLGLVLSALAVVREAKGLMAGGFLCFALVFFVAVQATFWRYQEPSELENALLDAYDLAYERALRNASEPWRQKLGAVHDTMGCCGKSSPLGRRGAEEQHLCQGSGQREDCLQEIRSFARKHLGAATLLFILTLAFTVHGMSLTSFLWLSIHYSRNLDRKGRYSLTAR